MRKSSKLLALFLATFMTCAIPAVITGCNKDDEPTNNTVTDPSRVKEGINLSVKSGESTEITVSEYINANGNTVEVSSSNSEVAEAVLANGKVTVTGKATGTANVKLKCVNVEVIFPVEVKEADKAAAPVFDDVTETLDLKDNNSVQVTLAPKSGGESFDITYSLAAELEGASIAEGKLTYTATSTGNVEISVNATCTEKANTQNVQQVNFKVKITVTDTTGTVVKHTVTVDGVAHEVEHGAEYTLPEYGKQIPEGKEFLGWLVGSETKQAGDKITVNGDVTVTAKIENKKYTVTVDGTPHTVEHGAKYTLPNYTGQIPSGKQFVGWQVGQEVKDAGTQITVTGNLTITAVIETAPAENPVKIKEGDKVTFASTDTSKQIDISEYITTNGNSVSIEMSANGVVTADKSGDTITLTKVAVGKINLVVTCKDVTVTFPVVVKNAAPTFEDVDISIDMFVNATGTATITPNGASTYLYGYAVSGATISGEGVISYTATATGTYNLTVTVTATDSATDEEEEVTFNINITVTDTTANRIVNGGFDNWNNGKPVGWIVTDGYGAAQTASKYWENPQEGFEGYDFDNIGTYFGETNEDLTGTLQSSPFTVGNSGWITFQLGSGHPDADIYLEVINAENNSVLARYRNFEWKDPERALKLVPYKLNLHDYLGDEVYIKITDNQAAGNMGFRTFYADSFESWYDEEPTNMTPDNEQVKSFVNLSLAPVVKDVITSLDLKDNSSLSYTLPKQTYGFMEDCTFTTQTENASIEGNTLTFTPSAAGTYNVTVKAQNKYGECTFKVKVNVTNSSYYVDNFNFETGDLSGWTVVSDDVNLSGGASADVYHEWVEHMPYNKSGEYFCKNAGAAEGAAWELKSSVFTLSGNGHISFKMGSMNAVIKVFQEDGTQIYAYTCKTYHADNALFPHFEQGANYVTMLTHYADLSSYVGQKLYVVIGNNGDSSNGFKFAHFDDIITYYDIGEDLSAKSDNVPLTCTGNGVTHEEGATMSVAWIKAENEYNA